MYVNAGLLVVQCSKGQAAERGKLGERGSADRSKPSESLSARGMEFERMSWMFDALAVYCSTA